MSKKTVAKKRPKARVVASGPGDIAEALEDLVKGLDKIADKIGDVVNELDRTASATELDQDVGKVFCDYEGCDEYAVSRRCREHSLFVEQVWVIYATDDGLSGAESSMTIRASEQSARDIMKDRIGDAEDEESRSVWRDMLDRWSGQHDVTIGPWVIQVKTVEL